MAEKVLYEDRAAAVECLDQSISFSLCGKLEQAIKSVKRAIELYPEYAPAYNKLGDYLIKSGRVSEAAEAYAMSLQFDGKNENSNFDMGCTLIHLGRYEEALGYLETALQLNPMHMQTYANMGRAFFMLGDAERAESCLTTAIEADQFDVMANFTLGSMLYEGDSVDRAEIHLKRVIERCEGLVLSKPRLAEAYYYAGYSYFIMGSLESALKNMLKAAEYDTDAIDYHYAFGMLYGDADVFCALAQIYSAMGNSQKAAESIEKALEIEPDNARFVQVKNELNI